MNIIGIFILFAHWSDCVDRNDKVFTLIGLELNLFRSLRHPIKLRDFKGESSHPGAIFLYLRTYEGNT